jgi:hypothetical protein
MLNEKELKLLDSNYTLKIYTSINERDRQRERERERERETERERQRQRWREEKGLGRMEGGREGGKVEKGRHATNIKLVIYYLINVKTSDSKEYLNHFFYFLCCYLS